MNCLALSVNKVAGKSRNQLCTRCRREKPLAEFTRFKRSGRLGIYCTLCRDYERARYVRKGHAVKRAYYDRLKASLSAIEWRANRLRSTLPFVTMEWLQGQWDRQAGRCALTGRPLDWETLEVDHIIPRARGGTDDLSNLRFVCREANRAKQHSLDKEFIALCREVVAEAAK